MGGHPRCRELPEEETPEATLCVTSRLLSEQRQRLKKATVPAEATRRRALTALLRLPLRVLAVLTIQAGGHQDSVGKGHVCAHSWVQALPSAWNTSPAYTHP